MRNTKDSNLEEPLIHLSIWIINDVVIDEEVETAKIVITTLNGL